MRDNFPIRPAEVDDMDTIIGLIDEAAAWLETKGTDQWAAPWPTRAARDARVLRGIRRGATWMVEDHGDPIATVTYWRKGNQKLWTTEEQRVPAVYVSRLIVSRRHMGDQIGAALIDWAGYQALAAWEAQWIRIDVWTTNEALHNYYDKRGFQHYSIREFGEDEYYPSAALFQKPTSEIDLDSVCRFIWPASKGRRPASPLG
jgi:GNAT superfamily N-acetyltransferase